MSDCARSCVTSVRTEPARVQSKGSKDRAAAGVDADRSGRGKKRLARPRNRRAVGKKPLCYRRIVLIWETGLG